MVAVEIDLESSEHGHERLGLSVMGPAYKVIKTHICPMQLLVREADGKAERSDEE